MKLTGIRQSWTLSAGLVVCLLLTNRSVSSQDQLLTAAELDSASAYLMAALAAPHERAYLQVLTQVVVRPDTTDSNTVYDLIVRYDPERFHDPHLGIYPLTFEDQFIQWGKRIALFTRSTDWPSGRYYLQNQASGHQAWIQTGATRLLYPEAKQNFPARVTIDDRAGQHSWLRRIHATKNATNLQAMTRWLRLLHREPRALVLMRTSAEVTTRDSIAAATAP